MGLDRVQERSMKQEGRGQGTTFERMGFPGGSYGKSVCLQCWRPGFDPWVGKISWRRKWKPTPILLNKDMT